jgi:hypothetical protein
MAARRSPHGRIRATRLPSIVKSPPPSIALFKERLVMTSPTVTTPQVVVTECRKFAGANAFVSPVSHTATTQSPDCGKEAARGAAPGPVKGAGTFSADTGTRGLAGTATTLDTVSPALIVMVAPGSPKKGAVTTWVSFQRIPETPAG